MRIEYIQVSWSKNKFMYYQVRSRDYNLYKEIKENSEYWIQQLRTQENPVGVGLKHSSYDIYTGFNFFSPSLFFAYHDVATPWYIYQVITQNMSRTCMKESGIFKFQLRINISKRKNTNNIITNNLYWRITF